LGGFPQSIFSMEASEPWHIGAGASSFFVSELALGPSEGCISKTA